VPFAEIQGLKVYYEQHGEGETIILLHHGFGCTRMWADIWPVLVVAGYRVILYDRRGYGQSERGTDFPAFYVSDSFRPASVQELDALRSQLALDSFHLVGQCEGGVIAIDYAIAHPGRVKTITIASTQCYTTIPMAEFNALKMPNSFSDQDSEIKEKLIEWHGEAHTEEFYEQFRTNGGAYGTDVFDLRVKLPSISCPALVIYPDRSFLFPVDQGIAMYLGLTKGELAILPHCGHNTYEEQPAQYTRLVLDFLQRQKQ
jgi:pimeloyl-ACP methyl ester carboxylesterase